MTYFHGDQEQLEAEREFVQSTHPCEPGSKKRVEVPFRERVLHGLEADCTTARGVRPMTNPWYASHLQV